MASSKIEWTESTWNPITGCTKISEGCRNCYAAVMARRLQAMENPKYINGFDITMHEGCLEDPFAWKKPKMIFVNSMSDLFHKDVPIEFIQKIFSVMNATPQHTYQILTKRSNRLVEVAPLLNWTENIWQGVSVEDEHNRFRIDDLRGVPAAIKFISFEPLIGDVKEVNLQAIDWAIIGGESGVGARPLQEEWVLNLKQQCEDQKTLFYFKQWGGKNKKKAGRELLGQTWDAMPKAAGNY